eukprot:COSAG01_NODE_2180_length_8215_cov_3.853006_7_plen_73_part_00
MSGATARTRATLEAQSADVWVLVMVVAAVVAVSVVVARTMGCRCCPGAGAGRVCVGACRVMLYLIPVQLSCA